MDQKFIPTTKPPIEDVRQRFEQWRESRKHRSSIPESLWEGAVSLCAGHTIYGISRLLRLDYNALYPASAAKELSGNRRFFQ